MGEVASHKFAVRQEILARLSASIRLRFSGSPLQVLAEFAGAHACAMTEEVAEIEFAGKIELAGNVLDREPFVSKKQPGLVQSRALDVLVDCPLP